MLKLWKRNKYRNGQKIKINQLELNLIFENPDFDFAARSILINSKLSFTTFYTGIYGFSAVFRIFLFLFYYWMLKYIFIKRSTWPL